MTQLFAQPYDISACGFFFCTADEYAAKAKTCRNDFGGQVEEFEIQFIDSDDDIDVDLARAWGLCQSNFAGFLEATETWCEFEKLNFIMAVGECGYKFDFESDSPEDLDVDYYQVEDLKELAEQFVDEGLFLGDIPTHIRPYLDMDAIARDLGFDYSMITIGGVRYAYRCA